MKSRQLWSKLYDWHIIDYNRLKSLDYNPTSANQKGHHYPDCDYQKLSKSKLVKDRRLKGFKSFTSLDSLITDQVLYCEPKFKHSKHLWIVYTIDRLLSLVDTNASTRFSLECPLAASFCVGASDRDKAALGSFNCDILVFGLVNDSLAHLFTIRPHLNVVHCFSWKSNFLYSGGKDGLLAKTDPFVIPDASKIAAVQTIGSEPLHHLFEISGSRLISTSGENTLTIWSLNDLSKLNVINVVGRIADCAQCNNYLLLATSEGVSLHLISNTTLHMMHYFPEPAIGVSLDSRYVLLKISNKIALLATIKEYLESSTYSPGIEFRKTDLFLANQAIVSQNPFGYYS